MDNKKVIAILLASGKGQRLNDITPKQYLLVNHSPIFLYSFKTFLFNKNVTDIIVVKNPLYDFDINKWINEEQLNIKKVNIIKGDLTNRNNSIVKAINFIDKNINIKDNDIILTHDVARPLVTNEIIENNINLLNQDNDYVVSTCIKCLDSIGININNNLDQILNRDQIVLEQTPQSACYRVFKEIYLSNINLYQKYFDKTNDFCELALLANKKIKIVEGDKLNFKITNKSDLLLFEAIVEWNLKALKKS